MNIDTLNAYCGPWLATVHACLRVGQTSIGGSAVALGSLWPRGRSGSKIRALVALASRLALGRDPGSAGESDAFAGGEASCFPPIPSHFRPEIRQDYPPNLSILISGGKENNCDALSNGERNGHSPAPNRRSSRSRDMWCLGESPRSATSSPSPP